ncbi:MAG: hypothetical protein Alpg2KO_13890 [Alphaproteobacteria bacterium]
MNDITFRPAQPPDAARIVEMSQSVGVHEGCPVSALTAQQFTQHCFGDSPLFECYVLDAKDDGLVGHVSFCKGFDFQEACPTIWIADLWVEPDWRSKGLATLLMTEVARQARISGSDVVQWMMAQDNTDADAFYKSIGARKDGGRPMFLPITEITRLAEHADSRILAQQDR